MAKQLRKALKQVEFYRKKNNTDWALLILSTFSNVAVAVPFVGAVLGVTINTLLEQLRTKSFAEVMRELRNQRVHGGVK